MSDDLRAQLTVYQQRTEHALKSYLGNQQSPTHHTANLYDAMGYSLLNGGKRIRPALVYSTASLFDHNTSDADLDRIACSIEMIHGYSLVHDDLPAMDDDDLRRGRPTCHKAFDEATAILAGDALQTRAFGLLCELECSAHLRITLIQLLADAAGANGMVGGQAMDLAATDHAITITHLQTIHQLKTGALIRAAVAMGAHAGGANDKQRQALDHYAANLGLSFQVQDDILDIEGDTQTLGKTQGADQALNKSTYPALLGLEAAKAKGHALHQQAIEALSLFDKRADPLRALSDYVINRHY